MRPSARKRLFLIGLAALPLWAPPVQAAPRKHASELDELKIVPNRYQRKKAALDHLMRKRERVDSELSVYLREARRTLKKKDYRQVARASVRRASVHFEFRGAGKRKLGSGYGFFVSPNGYVLVPFSVIRPAVRDSKVRVSVKFEPKGEAKGFRIVRCVEDKGEDLCLIQVKRKPRLFLSLKRALSGKSVSGVLPDGKTLRLKSRKGVLSAADPAALHGLTGAPVVSAEGRLIGIVSGAALKRGPSVEKALFSSRFKKAGYHGLIVGDLPVKSRKVRGGPGTQAVMKFCDEHLSRCADAVHSVCSQPGRGRDCFQLRRYLTQRSRSAGN